MQNTRHSFLGIMIICTVSIIFCLVSTFLLYQTKEKVSTAYKHPYTVSNTAREIHSRALDTKFFYRKLLSSETSDKKKLALIIHERFLKMNMDRDKIKKKYLGPEKDIERLFDATDAFHNALLEGLSYSPSHSKTEILSYIDANVEPAYIELEDSLKTVIAFSNGKMREFVGQSSFTVNMATAGSFFLILVVLTVAFFFYRLQKKAEQAIAYREKLFDILCNSIDDVFVIYHVRDKRIEYVSGNADRILGLGNNDISILYSRLSAANEKVLDDFSKQAPFDAPKGCDFSMKDTLTGEDRFMHLHLYPVKENAGTIRYVVSLSDRTHEVKTRQTLKDALASAQQANTAKRDFLSRMSHEIRTPMNAIIGMATIAAAHIQNHGRVADCLHKISFSSKHLMSLLNDVLDMSKIESGKLAVHHEEFDLPNLIDSIVSIIYPQTESQGQHFSVALSGIEEEKLVGDPLRINQILLNLLGNALKFTNPAAFVKVKVDELDGAPAGYGRYRFIVSDTGIGMSPEFVEHIFDPFERVRTSTISGIQGTGLGMAITKNLVDMMHGTISVKSTQGKGTSFTVELTLQLACEGATAAAQEAKTQHVDPSHRLRHSRILLVDDNDLNREIAITLLEGEGFTVECAVNGCEAVEKIMDAPSGHYQLVLMDVQMPVMNGYEATKAIRRLNDPTRAQVPILAMTADAFEEDRQKALRSGMNGHLTKPVEIDKLFEALDELLS